MTSTKPDSSTANLNNLDLNLDSSANASEFYIRPATRTSDAPALSRIALLTADAGKDGSTHHAYGELVGLYFALPYVRDLPGAGGFVLARKRRRQGQGSGAEGAGEGEGSLTNASDNSTATKGEGEDSDEVVGYILYALDSLAFQSTMEKEWLPPLREKYPLPVEGSSESESASAPAYDPPLKDADLVYVKRLHNPDPYHPACLAYCPTHMVRPFPSTHTYNLSYIWLI